MILFPGPSENGGDEPHVPVPAVLAWCAGGRRAGLAALAAEAADEAHLVLGLAVPRRPARAAPQPATAARCAPAGAPGNGAAAPGLGLLVAIPPRAGPGDGHRESGLHPGQHAEPPGRRR